MNISALLETLLAIVLVGVLIGVISFITIVGAFSAISLMMGV